MFLASASRSTLPSRPEACPYEQQEEQDDSFYNAGSSVHLDAILEPAVRLGVDCTEIYLSHVYFYMPALSVETLLAAYNQRRSPYQPGSLLYHGLVASCIPWMSAHSLTRAGFASRQEALKQEIELFETVLLADNDLEPMTTVQALVLIMYAVDQQDRDAGHGGAGRSRQWLRLALEMLQRLLRVDGKRAASNEGEDGRRIMIKKLWWCCCLMENLHLLRRLEDAAVAGAEEYKRVRESIRSPALDPRKAQPLSLDDLELAPAGLPQGSCSQYWSRMQSASCFIQRTRTLSHLTSLIHGSQQSKNTTRRRFLGGVEHMQHDGHLAKLQALAAEIASMETQQDMFLSSDLKATEDRILWRLHMENTLEAARVMMAACFAGWHGPWDAATGSDDQCLIWRELAFSKALQAVNATLATGSRYLLGMSLNSYAEEAGGTFAPSYSFFRGLMVSAHVLSFAAVDATAPQQALRRSTMQQLKQALSMNQQFWSHPVTATTTAASINGGALSPIIEWPHHEAELEADAMPQQTTAPTVASSTVSTPRVLAATPQVLVDGADESLEEQRILLSEYEDLWNEPLMGHRKEAASHWKEYETMYC